MHSITDLWQKQTYALFATTIPCPLCCHNNKNRQKKRKNKEEKRKMIFFRTQLYNLRNNFHNISASNRTVGWKDSSAVTWCTVPCLKRRVMFRLLYGLSSGALMACLECYRSPHHSFSSWLPHLFSALVRREFRISLFGFQYAKYKLEN